MSGAGYGFGSPLQGNIGDLMVWIYFSPTNLSIEDDGHKGQKLERRTEELHLDRSSNSCSRAERL